MPFQSFNDWKAISFIHIKWSDFAIEFRIIGGKSWIYVVVVVDVELKRVTQRKLCAT